jgi:hypothetical protein
MMRISREYLKENLFNLLSKDFNERKTSKELCDTLFISFRELKELITELRIDVPICSIETNGGGYWIATSNREINEFVGMIESRKAGYQKTIDVMQNHIKPEIYPSELFSMFKKKIRSTR